MKKWWVVLSILAFVVSCAPAADKPKTETKPDAKAAVKEAAKAADANSPLKTPADRISYSIGMNFGRNLKQAGLDVNVDILAQAMRDALSGGKVLMTDQEIRETMTGLQQEMMAKETQRMKDAGEKNIKEGENFLAENKKKEGVVTLPSGLQYKVLKEGAGAIPKATDAVTVNYRGTFINDNEFDSSYKRGEPVSFPVTGVIAGWTEALQLMKVGSKWQLFVPAKLAYGEQGFPPAITPNATLIFEVELLGIENPPAAEKPEAKMEIKPATPAKDAKKGK
jgi:FKBP-type peptidyl-prolyl cis-trans isomerase FklB